MTEVEKDRGEGRGEGKGSCVITFALGIYLLLLRATTKASERILSPNSWMAPLPKTVVAVRAAAPGWPKLIGESMRTSAVAAMTAIVSAHTCYMNS